jgi:hypothetical protein
MTAYKKGNKGNNRKNCVLIRQYDDSSEMITTPLMTEKQAIKGLLMFENKGYKVLKIETIKKETTKC